MLMLLTSIIPTHLSKRGHDLGPRFYNQIEIGGDRDCQIVYSIMASEG